jgi:hypothetical protein
MLRLKTPILSTKEKEFFCWGRRRPSVSWFWDSRGKNKKQQQHLSLISSLVHVFKIGPPYNLFHPPSLPVMATSSSQHGSLSPSPLGRLVQRAAGTVGSATRGREGTWRGAGGRWQGRRRGGLCSLFCQNRWIWNGCMR